MAFLLSAAAAPFITAGASIIGGLLAGRSRAAPTPPAPKPPPPAPIMISQTASRERARLRNRNSSTLVSPSNASTVDPMGSLGGGNVTRPTLLGL